VTLAFSTPYKCSYLTNLLIIHIWKKMVCIKIHHVIKMPWEVEKQLQLSTFTSVRAAMSPVWVEVLCETLVLSKYITFVLFYDAFFDFT